MKKAGFIFSGVSLSFLLYFFVRNMSVYVSILGENLKGTLIWAFNNEVYNLCFVALGVAAVLKSFYTLKKSAVICRYIAAAFAFAHLVCYVWGKIEINRFTSSMTGSPKFFDTNLLEMQDEITAVVFVLLIACCLLKDSFVKIKWCLAIICTVVFIFAGIIPFLLLLKFNDTITLRFVLNLVVSNFCYGAVILTGLSPIKEDENEQGENV